ncbi:MAG: undecaprenyl-diphosphate phosphatase, partial [Burkholderiales bacterium]|nr:undecaprenyl-diphosphate phosphatase [Burkholderiales bacterium]
MDTLLLAQAALMGVVEGLTEFLPVSSTGHLILAGRLLGFGAGMGHEKLAAFEVSIQTGAIFAVLLHYRQRLAAVARGFARDAAARRFVALVAIGFLPAVVIGLAFGSRVQALLFRPEVVAGAFIAGGLVILWAEGRAGAAPPRVTEVDAMSVADALKIGLVQCLAFVPGTSRSGAAIIGGMLFGLSRKAATEYTFFLAIPTLIGAGAYSLLKLRHALGAGDVPLFGTGLLFSFLAAWACVRWLLRWVSSHDFRPFAWYRIGFGLLVLA